MAEAVAAAAAVVVAVQAIKLSIDNVRYLGELKMEVMRSMNELRDRCEGYKSMLDDDMEWREHRDGQFVRENLAKKLVEIETYLKLNESKISRSRNPTQYGRKIYYVKLVAGHVPTFSLALDGLWTKLMLVKGLPLAWLDRSDSERGGIQYASSGKRFGQQPSESKCLPDSRLDALVEEVETRAISSPQRESLNADVEPSILLATGQPSIGKTTLCVNLLDGLEKQNGGSFFFPDGCVYLPMKDGLTEEEFAENVRDYLLQCIPRQCKYIPPSGADAQTRLSDVVDFFGLLVRSQRCIFVLDDVWPMRRSRDGQQWVQNPLDAVLSLASSNSLVLVCSSYRRAVELENHQAAGMIRVPLAERSLMEGVFLEAWNREARTSASALVIVRIKELGDGWAGAVTQVLDACGGLPAAAAAAGKALFRRKLAREDGADVLRDLEGGFCQSMIPGRGLPEAIKSNLDRTVKLCEDSIDKENQDDSMRVYMSVGRCQLRWTKSCIENWSGGSPDSVVQVPLSGVVSTYSQLGGGGGVARVLAGINELNKYLPISVSSDPNYVVICPLFYDHAKFLPALGSAPPVLVATAPTPPSAQQEHCPMEMAQ